MTTDELSSELFQAQGFLIIECAQPYKIGEIDVIESCVTGTGQTKCKIVARASRSQYAAQSSLANKIIGTNEFVVQENQYYYRVEAAD